MAPQGYRFSDVQPMLDGMSNATISYGGASVRCFWEEYDRSRLSAEVGNVFGRACEIHVASNALAGLDLGNNVVVDGTTYTVVEMEQLNGDVLRIIAVVP